MKQVKDQETGETTEDQPPPVTEHQSKYVNDCTRFIEDLSPRLNTSEQVKENAKEAIQEVPVKIRQHYHPCYMAAATLQIETRRSEDCSPRTIKQVATELENLLESRTHLSEENDHLSRTRRASKKLKKHRDLNLEPELPEDYLPYILDAVQVNEETRETAWKILEQIHGSYELQSKSKIGIAAAVAYIASEEHGEEITVNQLHQLVCRNKKTIRETTRLIQNQLLPDNPGKG